MSALSLPTFVIAGERRSGTTTLYQALAAHPDVFMVPTTDWNFFVDDDLVGAREATPGEVDLSEWTDRHTVEEYAAAFAPGVHCLARGHKGADLLFHQPSHARLVQFAPTAKLVIVLRNPVRRAWSHYWNEVAKGREHLGFEDAIAIESRRAERSAYERHHLSYVRRGCYDVTIATLLETVDLPRIHVTTLEQLTDEGGPALAALCEFIDVDAARLPAGPERHNENWATTRRRWATSGPASSVANAYERATEAVIVRRTRDSERRRRLRMTLNAPFRARADRMAVPAAAAADLAAIFEPHIAGLERVLGRSFDVLR